MNNKTNNNKKTTIMTSTMMMTFFVLVFVPAIMDVYADTVILTREHIPTFPENPFTIKDVTISSSGDLHAGVYALGIIGGNSERITPPFHPDNYIDFGEDLHLLFYGTDH